MIASNYHRLTVILCLLCPKTSVIIAVLIDFHNFRHGCYPYLFCILVQIKMHITNACSFSFVKILHYIWICENTNEKRIIVQFKLWNPVNSFVKMMLISIEILFIYISWKPFVEILHYDRFYRNTNRIRQNDNWNQKKIFSTNRIR